MRMFVIYKHPKDYPGKFVVREWVTAPLQSGYVDVCRLGMFARLAPTAVVDTLKEAQEALPPGFTLTYPNEADDPCIAEVWL